MVPKGLKALFKLSKALGIRVAGRGQAGEPRTARGSGCPVPVALLGAPGSVGSAEAAEAWADCTEVLYVLWGLGTDLSLGFGGQTDRWERGLSPPLQLGAQPTPSLSRKQETQDQMNSFGKGLGSGERESEVGPSGAGGAVISLLEGSGLVPSPEALQRTTLRHHALPVSTLQG